MKIKIALVLSLAMCLAVINSKAQSAIAIFKPANSGDEHYGFSTGKTEDDAKKKALGLLEAMVSQKVAPGTSGQKFIYRSTSKKGWYAIARGKDQYGHYWHYEAALGYEDEAAARKAVTNLLSGRGLHDIEILNSAEDE